MINSAHNISVEKILGKNDNNKELYYQIPPYQREYSWGKDNWERLFDDILENEEGYFLGSIICIKNNTNSDVIDGQQRLTTISILLNALYSIITAYDNEYSDQNILHLKKNKKKALAYGALDEMIFSDKPKLTLSIQNQNNDDYEYILYMNNILSSKEKTSNFGNRRISKAFEYFKSRLLEVNKEDFSLFQIDDLFLYLNKVLSALMVKIEVDDISSAFTLFESINNRGMPLTPIDLIKNSIIGKIGNNPENTNFQWQTIVKNIESYDEQIRFLRHYYHAFQENSKVKRPSFTKATKSNIIKIYSEHIKLDVEFIFNELINKSKIYTLFVHPYNIDKGDEFYKYQDKLIDLKRLGIAPSYSLLLYLFSTLKDDFSILLNFLENWFIRRHLTDYPATNKLDQIFLDLIAEIYNKEYNFENIENFMTTKERYSSDEKFQELLLNDDIYTVNTGATRCLLTKLEKSKRTRENTVDFWATTEKNKLIWSIEHILPQNPDDTSDWKNIFSENEMKDAVHKLGNLTLTCYNSNLSNQSYIKKISVRDKNNKDIGLKSANVKINKYLENKNNDIWNKEAIKERGNQLTIEIINLVKIQNEPK
jgi:uncharacterized protein with ParB-like and HNH nuclease domain